jgi:hypothetical protein
MAPRKQMREQNNPMFSRTPDSMLICMANAQNAVALPESMPGAPDGMKPPYAAAQPAQQPAPSPYAAPAPQQQAYGQQQYVPPGGQQYVPNSVPEQ